MPSLQRALDILHKQHRVPNVVISSIPLKPWLSSVLPPSICPQSPSGPSHLLCISSSLSTLPNGHIPTVDTSIVHAQCVPLIPGYFSGVGDLFSALLLAHFHPNLEPSTINATPLSEAASQALTKTYALLHMTQARASALPEEERLPTDDELDGEDPMRKTRRMRGRELKLVQGQDILRGVGVRELKDMMRWDRFWDSDVEAEASA
jgi:pyridoxine kinase